MSKNDMTIATLFCAVRMIARDNPVMAMGLLNNFLMAATPTEHDYRKFSKGRELTQQKHTYAPRNQR